MATIYFDMDGTIADFYSVPHWLDHLDAQRTTPYELAKPMVHPSMFTLVVWAMQRKGYRIAILSALSRTGDADFHARIKTAKSEWLKKNYPLIQWDEIIYVPYGSNKNEYATDAVKVLFDDEERNRSEWCGSAYTPDKILSVLWQMSA